MVPDYGDRIRLRRQVLGLTQEEFAAKVGATASAVIAWEKYRSRPTRHQGAIEAVLSISLSDSLDPTERALMSIDGLPPELQAEFRRMYRESLQGRQRAG